MPTKQPRNRVEVPEHVAAGSDHDYRKLLAFLELASGFSLAVARCNLPSLREEIIHRAIKDAADFGVLVQTVAIPSDSNLDFVGLIREHLSTGDADKRIALMVTGIDELVYKSYRPDSIQNLLTNVRPAFVAQLNFDRDRIARDLPYPMVLWLESESLNVLLREAPDFRQWISAHFEFGGTMAEHYALFRLQAKDVGSKTAGEIRDDLANLGALLKELEETRGADDILTLRKRYYLLKLLAERYFRLSKFVEARSNQGEALKIAERLEDRRIEAEIRLDIAATECVLGNPQRAIQEAERGLLIALEISDLNTQVGALINLGNAYSRLGEARHTIESYERAREISHKLKNQRLEMLCLQGLANTFANRGEYAPARKSYEQALSFALELGDRRQQAALIANLGVVETELRNIHAAIKHYEWALQIFREIGDRQGEANVLNGLGAIYRVQREFHRSIAFLSEALTIFREAGDREGEANALSNLGSSYGALQDFSRAIQSHLQALDIGLFIGDKRNQAINLGNLATDYGLLGDLPRSIEYREKQLALARQIGDRSIEASALQNLSIMLHRVGNQSTAITTGEEALQILASLGDRDTTALQQTLATWRRDQETLKGI